MIGIDVAADRSRSGSARRAPSRASPTSPTPRRSPRRCEGAELVVHTAAYVREWGEMEEFIEVNVRGTVNVLDAAEAGRRRARRPPQLGRRLRLRRRGRPGRVRPPPLRRDPLHRHEERLGPDRAPPRRGRDPARRRLRAGVGSVDGCGRWSCCARARWRCPGKGDGTMLPVYIDDLVEAIVLGAPPRRARARPTPSGTARRSASTTTSPASRRSPAAGRPGGCRGRCCAAVAGAPSWSRGCAAARRGSAGTGSPWSTAAAPPRTAGRARSWAGSRRWASTRACVAAPTGFRHPAKDRAACVPIRARPRTGAIRACANGTTDGNRSSRGRTRTTARLEAWSAASRTRSSRSTRAARSTTSTRPPSELFGYPAERARSAELRRAARRAPPGRVRRAPARPARRRRDGCRCSASTER